MSNHYVEWLEKQHDHLVSQIRDKEKLIGEQIAQLTVKDMLLKDRSDELSDYADENETLKEQVISLTNDLASTRDELSTLKALTIDTSEIENLRSEIRTLKQDNVRLKEELEDAWAEEEEWSWDK
jgi:predicted  nucleic acid-binding Zn-ribbon protein